MSTTISTDSGASQTFHMLGHAENAPIDEAIRQHARACDLVIRTIAEENDAFLYQRKRGAAVEAARLREGIIEHCRNRHEDTDSINDLLEGIGLEKIVTKYRVTLEIEGTTVLEVIVEADNEREAEDIVSNGVDQYTDTVEVEFGYNGPGEVEDENTYEYEIGSLTDFLSYSYNVEEYED